MARVLSFNQEVERSIITTYRRSIWNEFIEACQDYKLVNDNDKIAVCISGGKDSVLLAKCMQQLKRVSSTNFELKFICMDPGYKQTDRELIEENCRKLEIPVEFFETTVFSDAEKASPGKPCYMCARMRRGYLYAKAQELGCNKIALGHHRSDAVETVLLGMFYSAQLQCMLPKLKSDNFENMELIRPLYRVHEKDIINWKKNNNLHFIQCACKFVESYSNTENPGVISKRQEVKNIIKQLEKTNPEIEDNIFRAIHNLRVDTFPQYKVNGEWRVPEGYAEISDV